MNVSSTAAFNFKKSLENEISRKQALVNKWLTVKRVYKKDGGAFAAISKNFTNCSIYNDIGTIRPGAKRIMISTQAEGCGWISDEIPLTMSTHDADRRGYNTEGRTVPAPSYVVKYINLNADEVENEINLKIAAYKNSILDYKKELETLDAAIDVLKAGVEKITADLAAVTNISSYQMFKLLY